MNPIEVILNRPGDNKTKLRADIRSKPHHSPWRRNFHNYNLPYAGRKSSTSRIAGGWEFSRDNPYSKTVQSEEFANLFVSLKISRTLD